MSGFRTFEAEAVRALVGDRLEADLLTVILSSSHPATCDHTGSGYFLTVGHPDLPRDRIVSSEPAVIGESDGLTAGSLVFVEDHELTLECHCWGGESLPEGFRDQDVEIKILP